MKIPYLPSLLLFFYAVCCYPQLKGQQRLDSLLKVLKTQNDIEKKALTYTKIVEFHTYNDSKTGIAYANELIELSKKKDYGVGLVLGNFVKANCFGAMQQMDSSGHYHEKTLSIAKAYNINTCVAGALANLSVIEGQNGNYVRAIALMDSVAKINLLENDYLNYGITLNNKAYHFYEQGDFLNAMSGFQQALNVLDTINRNLFRKADVLRNIGKLNYQENDTEDALKYLMQAHKIYEDENDHLFQAYIWTDVGNVHVSDKAYAKAIEAYEKSLAIGLEYGFSDVKVYAYTNIATTLREQGNYKKSLEYFQKQQESMDYDESIANQISGLYNLGYTYTLLNNKKKALEILNRSVHLADSVHQENELKNALGFRARTFEKFGDFELALKDEKRMALIKDSLFTLKKTRQIEQLQTIYETEKKEAAIALQKEEINTLNEKAKVDKLTKGLYAGGMASALALSGLLVFGYQQRIKKNRMAREKQEAIYKQEIAHKKKELASQTLHLVQKNTFIQELRDNLENLKSSPEKFKLEFRRIVMLLKKQNASDKDWEVFKSYFTEVHNDFDQKLKTLYPEISEKEIRLAAFLRMNLTTKEIAATLNVLPDSILKSKYRLKKKLGLDKETDLNSFLSSL